jgi:uncharacterized protein
METILISGGTGLIGKHLSKKLKEKGFNVAVLSRKSNTDSDIPAYTWDPENHYIDQKAVSEADYIIHLAGAGIGDKRWSEKRKQILFDSRIKTAELLKDAVKCSGTKPRAFISASAIGFYGAITSDKIFSESDKPADDLQGRLCREWEEAADRFEEAGIRSVKIRTGVVLTPSGGALASMVTPVKLWIGSKLGSGGQYLPWIHIDDLCNIYLKAVTDSSMRGAYNAVAPDHKTNKEFIVTLAEVLKKPFIFPGVPAILMKILFGKMSEILLKGSRVSSEKIVKAGYTFHFPDLESALKDLLHCH